jgi:hypothetical protein
MYKLIDEVDHILLELHSVKCSNEVRQHLRKIEWLIIDKFSKLRKDLDELSDRLEELYAAEVCSNDMAGDG